MQMAAKFVSGYNISVSKEENFLDMYKAEKLNNQKLRFYIV